MPSKVAGVSHAGQAVDGLADDVALAVVPLVSSTRRQPTQRRLTWWPRLLGRADGASRSRPAAGRRWRRRPPVARGDGLDGVVGQHVPVGIEVVVGGDEVRVGTGPDVLEPPQLHVGQVLDGAEQAGQRRRPDVARLVVVEVLHEPQRHGAGGRGTRAGWRARRRPGVAAGGGTSGDLGRRSPGMRAPGPRATVLTDRSSSVRRTPNAAAHPRRVPRRVPSPSSTPTPSPARHPGRLQVGRGRRRRGAVRGGRPRGRAAPDRAAGQGLAQRPRPTPAWAGSPARPSSAAASSRPAYDRALQPRSRPTTRCPDQSFFGIGLGMVAPTILAHAIPRCAKDATCARMYRGDIVGCQLFSEPGAGSDLAGLQTAGRARRRRVDHHRPEGVDLGRAVLATSARSSAAPTPTCPSTRASPASSSTCTRPASRCGRCAR